MKKFPLAHAFTSLQELKSIEFPGEVFKALGYESTAVTPKTYNGVAVLSRPPIQVIGTRLWGDAEDALRTFRESADERHLYRLPCTAELSRKPAYNLRRVLILRVASR